MGVTTERGLIVNAREGTVTTALTRLQQGAEINYMPIEFTQSAAAGDATSTQALTVMPAGKHKVLSIVLVTSAFGSSRVLDVGYEAHTKTDGTTAVTASANAFKDDLDVSSAATTRIEINKAMDSISGYVINSTVAGGTIPAGATITGYVTYV